MRWLSFEAFQRPCRKNYFSSYIWHKSFIQTVKCSFFRQIIVYQSFTGASFTFSFFFLRGKVLCFGMHRQVACENVYCLKRSEDLVEKMISPIISDTNHCAAHILLFLINYFSSRKSSVFRHTFPSRALVLGPCLLCVCSMKMGLLKPVGSIWQKKRSIFDLTAKYSLF